MLGFRHETCLQARHVLCLMPRGCLGRLQISCLLTQQMSWLQTQQMSCLQTQQMSCLQTIQASCGRIRPTSWVFYVGKIQKMCFSPRGSVSSFEGWVLLRISLGLAVRTDWSDVKKLQKSASGEIWGRDFGSGTFLGETWSRKNWFCGGMILWWGFRGIHPAQMNAMVPRSHMGRLLCPKPRAFCVFSRDFQFS